MTTKPSTLADLVPDFIRRLITYTDEITYFGENSVGNAIAQATGEQILNRGETLYRALLRRQTLLGSSGDSLTEVAAEYGAPRLGSTHAQVHVIVQPWVTTVTAITTGLIEVEDSTHFEVGDTARITTDDGATHEVVEILAITTGTGPNGGDELDVGLVVNTYDPDTETIRLLLRETLAAGTVFRSSVGVTLESLEDVTVGDANPVLAGESAALALADKVLCEATRSGEVGNVEALTITALQVANDKIRAVFNPGRAAGGVDEEEDFSLKYRAAHQAQIAAVETGAALEALARAGNVNVLRAFVEDSPSVSTLRIRVLTRSGGGLSADARTALGEWMRMHLRSELAVEVLNVVPTAVEVVADITLTPGEGTVAERLAAAWRSAATGLAVFVDWRKWPAGGVVDEADLIAKVKAAEGVATLVTSSFEPSADVEVGETSVPRLVRLRLTDITTNQTFGATLETTY